MRLSEVKEYSEKYSNENKVDGEALSYSFKKGFLTKNDLLNIIKSAHSKKDRNIEKAVEKIKKTDNNEIENITKKAFSSDSDEEETLKLLTKIDGITIRNASYILTFYDPKKYCIIESNIYDEVFGTNADNRPSIYSKKRYLELLKTVRHFSENYEINASEVGYAFYQRNYEKSKEKTHLGIKDIEISERPREKMLKKGAKELNTSELLAIILRVGSQRENVTDMSRRIISEYKLEKLFDYSLKELQEIKGIGPNKAMQILAISELGKRYNKSKNPITKITRAEDVYDYFKEDLQDQKQENFYILMLNNRNHIIKSEFITRGVLDASIIHPREIFKPAIKNSAAKIILIHNHPSGDPEPSQEDLDITKKIINIGKEMDIKVLDHVIIGGGGGNGNDGKDKESEEKEGYWSWIEKS